jgi:hypothetical protein
MGERSLRGPFFFLPGFVSELVFFVNRLDYCVNRPDYFLERLDSLRFRLDFSSKRLELLKFRPDSSNVGAALRLRFSTCPAPGLRGSRS